MKFIPGTIHDLSHLRPLPGNWRELVEEGHPLAAPTGEEIRLLRVMRDFGDGDLKFGWDEWTFSKTYLGTETISHWVPREAPGGYVGECVRLAPIAVKDGRPLHLGDVIEASGNDPMQWGKPFALRIEYRITQRILAGAEWRWPVEKKPCQA